MVIKVFFSVLVLCTAAVVAVVLAIHFRVKRHLRQEPGNTSHTEAGRDGVDEPGPAADLAAAVGGVEERVEGAAPRVIQRTASASGEEHSK